MKNNNILTDRQLSSLNSIAHNDKFHKALIKINKDYSNFENFITSFEKYVNKKLLTIKKNKYSFDDKLFDSIITRLEILDKHKKIALRIYLESQKKNRYFLVLTKSIHEYFSHHFNSPPQTGIAIVAYVLTFNIWIEDDNDLDKTMSFLGKTIDYIKKIEPFLKK